MTTVRRFGTSASLCVCVGLCVPVAEEFVPKDLIGKVKPYDAMV